MKSLALLAMAVVVSTAAAEPVGLHPRNTAISDEYRVLAERGNPSAQAALGFLTLKENPEAALRWLIAAARQGDLNCQLAAAETLTAQRNYDEALFWYRRASRRSVRAVYALGTMYEAGDGVPRSYTAAVQFYRRAAVSGLAEAQTRLGNLYLIGAGVPLDYGEARIWYLRAASQGDGEALLNLAGLFFHGLGVPRDVAHARAWALAAKRVRARDADSFLALIDSTGP